MGSVKALLILIAIGLLLFVALLAEARMGYASRATFTLRDEFEVREQYPGGHFVDGNTAYEICDHGYKIRLYPDGLKLFFPQRPCWK